MQEFIDELKAKVGLTAEQAQKAIETIVEKVKTKVPEALHGSINSMFGNSGEASGESEDLMQKARDFASQAKQRAEDFSEDAREKLSELSDEAEDLAKNVGDKISGFFGGGKAPEEKA